MLVLVLAVHNATHRALKLQASACDTIGRVRADDDSEANCLISRPIRVERA